MVQPSKRARNGQCDRLAHYRLPLARLRVYLCGMAKTRAANGRRAGKAALRAALDALGQLSVVRAAEAAGVGRQLLHRYADPDADNLPSGDTLRAVADFLDAGAAELRQVARKLRQHGKAAPVLP